MADLTKRERVLAARGKRLEKIFERTTGEKKLRALRVLAHVAAQLRALKAFAPMTSLGGGVA